MKNPALRAYPRSQHAPLIPMQGEASILAWLESTGRLRERDDVEASSDREEEEEINELMDGEDNSFDDDDDDSSMALEE